jgi:hypothetical protein
VLAAAAVQAVGHLALRGGVVLDVGVEEQQGDPPDLRLPHLGDQRAGIGQPDPDLQRCRARVVCLAQEGDGQAVRVENGIDLLLPALPRQRLGEVARSVEQADTDDGDPEVRRGLEVVAGEDAETAGVLGQGRSDAELRREVRDRGRDVGQRLVPAVVGEVAAEVSGRALDPADDLVVLRQGGQPVGTERTEQLHRVVPDLFPQVRLEAAEEVLRPGVP